MSTKHPLYGMKVRWRGGGARANCGNDEIFTVSDMGTFNITKIRDFARLWPRKFIWTRSTIDQDMVDYIWRKNDPDRARLAEMTEQDVDRRNAIALLTGKTIDGVAETQLLDGNHYILKCWELGRREYELMIVPKSIERFFKLWLEVKVGSEWRTVDPDLILAATVGKYIRPAADGRSGRMGEAKRKRLSLALQGLMVSGEPMFDKDTREQINLQELWQMPPEFKMERRRPLPGAVFEAVDSRSSLAVGDIFRLRLPSGDLYQGPAGERQWYVERIGPDGIPNCIPSFTLAEADKYQPHWRRNLP